jgi:ADP-ribose pyrophosphatase YjhB (NUDIX family)
MQKRRITVRGLICKDNQLLCVRHKINRNRNLDKGKDYWSTPGGGVEPGESLSVALKRELVEELGVEPKIGDLLFIHQFIHNNEERLEFLLNILNPEDYSRVDLNKTTHGAIEIAEVSFINPKNEKLLPEFLKSIDIDKCIKSGKTEIVSYI